MWDREEVRIRITQLYRLGKDISYTGVWEEHPHGLFAAGHYFPNWSHAVTSCGIDYSKVRSSSMPPGITLAVGRMPSLLWV